jgi:large subunit ribosomal protein L25
MALVELKGQGRDDRGKGAARTLRSRGLLPGVVYGPGGENQLVTIDAHSFDGLLRRATAGTVIVDLKIEGKGPEGVKVLVKEVQRDPITSRPLHVDFLHIAMDRPVRLVVGVRLAGIPEGVKVEGGFLEQTLRDLEIECLPGAVPEFVTVDVSSLKVGQSIHAGEMNIPDVTILTHPERPVAVVHGKAAEEEAPAAAAAAPAEGEAAAEAAPAEEGGGKKKGSPQGGAKSGA